MGESAMRKIPRGAFIIAGLVVLGLWWMRRSSQRADAAAANASYGGWPIGAVPASFSYLSSAAPAPSDTPIGGLSAVDSAALAMLQNLVGGLAGSAGGSSTTSGGTVGVTTSRASGGLETPFLPAGFSGGEVQAAAARYAAGRSYGGAPYVPHMVVQEGHTETRNGVPGVYIKYSTGAGESTEWTPLR
jgi:hypothetical protein